MKTFYNEWDKNAAQWLRNLIAAGQLPDGEVNDQDIKQLSGQSVSGARQAHFFAGIGGWPLALQLAGWPEDREVWTASCPCQPFSCAGRGEGFDDERDLWPTLFDNLIKERNPETIFGEQVASKAGLLWLDRVYADLEGAGYAVAAFDLCAAGISAPHIRQRLYWMAHRVSEQTNQEQQEPDANERGGTPDSISGCGVDSGILHPVQPGLEGQSRHGDGGNEPGRLDTEANGPSINASGGNGLPDTERVGLSGQLWGGARCELKDGQPRDDAWGQAVIGRWQDGTARRFEPGILPLAHGVPGRVGQIRGYGNAIVPPLAAEFIKAVMEVIL